MKIDAASNPAAQDPESANAAARMIDMWFPCGEVDAAVLTRTGSGLSEKALFTWFASRPIAQARAGVLCSLLPDTADNRKHVLAAVSNGNADALAALRHQIMVQHGGRSPVVLDMFSGRAIIPLEAARAGARAIGIDLSPVATLGGRLLAEYPQRDWSNEPALPFGESAGLMAVGRPQRQEISGLPTGQREPRLLADVRAVLDEVGRRVTAAVADHYPGNPLNSGATPWSYLWAVTIPCDGCGQRFPIIGSLVLRHPCRRTADRGQSFRVLTGDGGWYVQIHEGAPTQAPTFAAPDGKPGKSARCPFPTCGRQHNVDTVKAKGKAGQYLDALLAVAEELPDTKLKSFRTPRQDETDAAERARLELLTRSKDGRSLVPTEDIAPSSSVDARNYGYMTYGSLMNDRQALLFSTTAETISEMFSELATAVSPAYATVLCCYAAANLTKQLRRATRGARRETIGRADGSKSNGIKVGDIFANQSTIAHAFDYLEAGPGRGPGTWASVSVSLLAALRKVTFEGSADVSSAMVRAGSAVALPFRDASVDAVICDPPYYQMIAYADSSDLFYVWLKRALAGASPDLFGGTSDDKYGLQDKSEEIIVKARGAKQYGDHRTEEFYERMLQRSFLEARRVLKPEGHLTVIFGHSDPDAWLRLLTALTDAEFVVTSSWPSRTETAVTGVASLFVTVTIGARVARPGRPIGIAAQVDAEVAAEVKARCRGWDADGLALQDQLMASYGAALQIVGRYSKVISPDAAAVGLQHYMGLALRSVRDAIALRLNSLPLETFDPLTRLAVFWLEAKGLSDVAKGDARFFAQCDGLRLEDIRGPILTETRGGFRLRHDAPGRITPASSNYEIVRGMAASWTSGTEAAAACMATAQRSPTDAHIWAIIDWLATKLPASSPVAVALAALKRNRASIQASVAAQNTANASTLEEQL